MIRSKAPAESEKKSFWDFEKPLPYIQKAVPGAVWKNYCFGSADPDFVKVMQGIVDKRGKRVFSDREIKDYAMQGLNIYDHAYAMNQLTPQGEDYSTVTNPMVLRAAFDKQVAGRFSQMKQEAAELKKASKSNQV